MNIQKSTSQILLDHGLKIVAEKGLRGLTVRELAGRAEVNLGSFVYHFNTRERFVEQLVELWYAPIYQELKITAKSEAQHDAIGKLRATLFQLIGFISQNAGFIAHLVADALAGERAAQAFLLKLPERHPKLLLALIASAQLEGSIIPEPPMHLLMFIMASVGVPMLLAFGSLQDNDWLPPEAERFKQLMRDPHAAQQRLQWALLGISTLGSGHYD